MRLLHGLAKIHESFDEPNLVSRAGLVLVMALAQRAGLAALAGQHVAIADRCAMYPHLKVPCLVAGMLGGDGQHRRYGSAAVPMNRKVITASAAPGTSQTVRPVHARHHRCPFFRMAICSALAGRWNSMASPSRTSSVPRTMPSARLRLFPLAIHAVYAP